MQNDQVSVGAEPTASGRPQPWPVTDIERARDFLASALASRSVITIRELELLVDLDDEVARRTGSTPQALDRLAFRLRQKLERQLAVISVVRRARGTTAQEASA